MTKNIVTMILSPGVVLSQAVILAAVVYLLFFRKKYPAVLNFISKHSLLLVFFISLIATSASLYYSLIAGFKPCDLCWYQRIFMYPLVIISALALTKKDRRIVDYILSLAIVGGLISLYHNYIYYSNNGLNSFCQLGGSDVSCVKRYVLELGYITIPMMALTGFALIIILIIFHKLYYKNSNQN